MSMDTWEAGTDVWKLVQHHISHNHPNLALVDKEIAVIFRAKASKSGGQVVLGKADYKFILEIAGDEWGKMGDPQRSALIDHLLCACKVEEDEKTGDLKFSIASPEVSFFWDELKRHGDWRTRPQQEAGDSTNVEGVLGMMNDEETEG